MLCSDDVQQRHLFQKKITRLFAAVRLQFADIQLIQFEIGVAHGPALELPRVFLRRDVQDGEFGMTPIALETELMSSMAM